ncbi:MAG TPA: DedA family protein [Vicinamibacterales bacterium]|nr:DedA family protein [Vicinamibacterales bacterium]
MPQWLTDLFAHYGYAAVFLGVFLENTGLPVPGETMVLAGGALAHAGHLSLAWVIVIAIVAAILGDNLGFYIGRNGGRRLVERFGAAIGVTRARLAEFDRFFDRHGSKTVFVARFITGLRVVCAVLAGGSGMPWPTFLFFNAAGAVVWSTTIAVVGYFLGKSWETIERVIGGAGLVGLALAIVLVVVWIKKKGM